MDGGNEGRLASALVLIVRRVGGGIPKKGWGKREVVASSSSSSNCWVNKTDSDGSSFSGGKRLGGISLPLFSWEIECCSLFPLFFFRKVFFCVWGTESRQSNAGIPFSIWLVFRSSSSFLLFLTRTKVVKTRACLFRNVFPSFLVAPECQSEVRKLPPSLPSPTQKSAPCLSLLPSNERNAYFFLVLRERLSLEPWGQE